MKRLDFHVHCNATESRQVAVLAQACRERDTVALLTGGLHYGSHDYAPNEEVLKICQKYPDTFIPAARVELWDTKPEPDQIERMADMGFKALKFIYPYYGYDHDLYMPIYEAAERRALPMLFHTGNFRPSEEDARCRRPMLKNMHPINLDRIARSFQKVPIVMAHLGTSIFRAEAAEYLKMLPNLYADLAGSGSWGALSAEELVHLMRPPIARIDSGCEMFRKLILGSDAYVTHPHLIGQAQAHYEAILDKIGAPQTIREAVMGGTAAEWLRVTL